MITLIAFFMMDSAAGRMLVVDDDAGLLKVMDGYLSRLGYQVEACRGAAQAWELVQASPSFYAGVIVDLNMPGMRGEELVYRILKLNTSMRLVVMSGYPSELTGLDPLDLGRIRFLQKPFTPQQLAAALEASA